MPDVISSGITSSFVVPPPVVKSAFGELVVVEPTAAVQLVFPYNINSRFIQTRANNAGTLTQADSMAVLQTGASANSSVALVSRVPVKYDPGQGVSSMFTGVFTAGAANSEQIIGVGETGEGFFFGFDGTAFGILHKHLGTPEVQTLTVTTGAVTATGNITINLDGVAKTVAVVAGDSAREVAVKISNAVFDDVGLGWTPGIDSSTVIFIAWSSGNKTDTFSLVDTDTTGVVGAFVETIAGTAVTDDWTAQADWNIDKMDGTGLSGMTLDTTKGNVFKVSFQFLGFGAIRYFVEDSDSGNFQLVHILKYANSATVPSIQNPTLHLFAAVTNTSNATNITLKTGSMAAFVEGDVHLQLGVTNAASNTNLSVGTTEIPILSIRNALTHGGKLNRVRMSPKFLTISTDGTKSIIIRARAGPTLTGPVAFQPINLNTSVACKDIAATGITGGTETFTLVLGKVASTTLDLTTLDAGVEPGEIRSLTAEATSGTGHDVTMSVVWEEEF